jgi:transcription initiation factor TFIID subunit TAF12
MYSHPSSVISSTFMYTYHYLGVIVKTNRTQYHACTDVTGYGIVGHATNLMLNQPTLTVPSTQSASSSSTDEQQQQQQQQKQQQQQEQQFLQMILHTLPCIAKTFAVNDNILDFQLTTGYSAETSGGLLICMSPKDATLFCSELQQLEGTTNTGNTSNSTGPWIVGTIGTRSTTTSHTTTTIHDDRNNNNTTSSDDDAPVISPTDVKIIEVDY